MKGLRLLQKRTLLRLALFLLAGAIINVAVAWKYAFNHPGMTSPIVRDRFDRGVDFELITPGQTGNLGAYFMENGYFGAPTKSMMCCFHNQGEVRHGLRLRNIRGQHPSRVYGLPLMPVWPGFAINTIFYAGILWLLFTAPAKLRQRIGWVRIKRGLCPACKYPVSTNPRCTECGEKVRRTC